MDPIEFRDSRKATLAYAIASLLLSLVSLAALGHPVHGATPPVWLPVAFLVAAVALGWIVVRPRRLVAHAQGFTVDGGFAWRATTVRWQDVGEFYVFHMGKGGEAIGCRLKPPPRDYIHLADGPPPPAGEITLPQGWDRAPETMVQELNSYRARALGELSVPGRRADEAGAVGSG